MGTGEIMDSTEAMRARVKELATPARDDYDRAVLCVLRDFDKIEAALRAVITEPHGCVFCDSGKLRNPAKPHDPTCGFAMASALIA